MDDISLTAYDFVVIGIIFLFVSRGIWIGLLKQIVVLLALYVGYFAASRYHDQLFPFLKDLSDNPKVIFLSSYVLLFAATYLLVTLLGMTLAHVVTLSISHWFDKLLGGVLGLAKAVIIVVLMHMILGTLTAPENTTLSSCQSCPTLDRFCDLARGVIKDKDVREALTRKMPAITVEDVRDILFPDDPADASGDSE